MKAFTRIFLLTSFTVSLLGMSAPGWAGRAIPACMDHGQAIGVNDEQVAQWKTSTKNQFLARAHVTGTIHQVFADHSGHNHFEIQMDTIGGATLEIIYNKSFGALPSLRAGMKVEACGDYITSIAQSGAYPPSPDGAILHWVHNTSHGGHTGSGHDAGYVAVDGQVYGGY